MAAAGLALFYLAVSLVLRPFDDLPLVDDWLYGWSVENFLRKGELRLSDWQAVYCYAQILWGALFCLPFGFSFAALRASTVALAWIGAVAFYASLREIDVAPRHAALTTLVVLVNPVFFVLTFSFMTDVPFVSLCAVAMFFYLRGLRGRGEWSFWAGSAVAVAAFFVRQLGAAVPLALLAFVAADAVRGRFRAGRLLAALLPLALLALTVAWMREGGQVTADSVRKLRAVRYWLSLSPLGYATVTLRMLLHLGLGLVPLAIPFYVRSRRRHALVASLAVLAALEFAGVAWRGKLPSPLIEGGIWVLREIGGARLLIEGGGRPPSFSWTTAPLVFVALVSAAAIVVAFGALAVRIPREPASIFCLYATVHVGLIAAMWFFYDRYYLVLLPPLAAVLAWQGPPRPAWTGAAAALLLALSLAGTWDNLRLVETTARAFDWVRSQGVAVADVDAGYALNGWNLYVHPENLPAGATPARSVPFVTSQERKPYAVALGPLDGYRIVRSFSWSPRLLQETSTVYVLQRVR